MLALYPVLSLRLAVPRDDGDTDHDVVATAAGIPEHARADLFDAICSLVPHLRPRLSLTVADTTFAEPARMEDVAQAFAAAAVDAESRESIGMGRAA